MNDLTLPVFLLVDSWTRTMGF